MVLGAVEGPDGRGDARGGDVREALRVLADALEADEVRHGVVGEERAHLVVEGDRVVTRSTYLHHGLSQVVSRWLEDDGELYVVRNELVNKDGMLLDAVLYFDRVSKGK